MAVVSTRTPTCWVMCLVVIGVGLCLAQARPVLASAGMHAVTEAGLAISVKREVPAGGRELLDRHFRVSMINPTPNSICLTWNRGEALPRGFNVTVVGSSGRLPEAARPTRATNGAADDIRRIAPGEHLTLLLDLAESHAGWIDDKYTLHLRLTPDASIVRQISQRPQGKECHVVTKSVVLAPLAFSVGGLPGSPTLLDHSARWRSNASADERFLALNWLGRNALMLGMPRVEVLALLGAPAAESALPQWTYTSGLAGLKLIFEQDLLVKVDWFE